MNTWTKIWAGACMAAMMSAAGAAETAKSEHDSRAMTTQECSAYMAKQAKSNALKDETAKQNEAYCAKRLEKTMAKAGKLPSATMTTK